MEFHRKAGEISATPSSNQQIRVVGIGAAGSNILRRIEADGADASLLIGIDTDGRALATSVAGTKIQLGEDLLMGMSCGGDPDLGREAAQASEATIRDALQGVDLLFLCTGLGGGTASGAAPEVARIAREAGCFVLVFVTLPFHFEGRRRVEQAEKALDALRPYAGALLTFENDKLGELIVPKDGVDKAFEVVDMTICHSVRAITTMLEKPGMIRVGMKELLAVLNGQDARCLFGFGKATGAKRAEVAVSAALDNPLLHDGDLLSQAGTVMVHISGSRSVTLSEVESVMGRITEGLAPATEVLFGVSASDELGDELWVAIISSIDRGRRHQAVLPAPKQETTPLATSPVPRVQPTQIQPSQVQPSQVQPSQVQPSQVQPSQVTPARVQPIPSPALAVPPAAPPPGKGLENPTDELAAPYPSPAVVPRAAVSPSPQPLTPAQPVVEPGPQAEAPPLVEEMGPPKPRLKAPLPAPSPAPLPLKPSHLSAVAASPALVNPQHLMGAKEAMSSASALFQVAESGSPQAAPELSPEELARKVQIDYPGGKGDSGSNDGAATITLEQPKPSVASKAVAATESKTPLSPKLDPAPTSENIVAMPPAETAAPGLGGTPAAGPKAMVVPTAVQRVQGTPQPASRSAASPRGAGRFDQVEPTVIDGQNLDVPTYLRSRKRSG